MIVCKCKGCKNRFIGCHSKCDDYVKYRKEKNKVIQEKEKQNIVELIHHDNVINNKPKSWNKYKKEHRKGL